MITCILLLTTGCATPRIGSPSDYLPLAIGRSWVYTIEESGRTPFELTTRLLGSDRRSLPDENDVEFMQVYGRLEPEGPDLTKSIYAMASTGPRELVFNAWAWSLEHDPPIPLLPTTVRPLTSVDWQGVLTYRGQSHETTARVRVETEAPKHTPIGPLRCVEVVTVYATGLVATRWFSRGIGLVELRIEGAGSDTTAALRQWM